MVKFSRQLEAQMIPEWRDAFVNYRHLKKNVKKIKFSHPSPHHSHSHQGGGSGGGGGGGFSLLDPIRDLVRSCSYQHNRNHHHTPQQGEDEEQYEVELMHSREDEVKQFFEKLEEELQKVNRFYTVKEAEFVERGDVLNKQLQILVDLKHILNERRRLKRLNSDISISYHSRLSHLNSPSSFCDSPPSGTDDMSLSVSEAVSPTVTDELVAALERNGVTFMGPTKSKAKNKGGAGGRPRMTTMRIDIPPTTPTRTISAVTSVIWEDVVNSSSGGGPGKERSGDYVTRKKIQCAEKMIRGAFVELYRGLGLLKTYSSLNMVAFRKILKKFDKVSNQHESGAFLQKVKRSHFVSSDKVVRLGDDVESIFTKHFASNDRKKAMKFLRPQQPKDSHVITFFVGLFTGSFVTLFSVYAILAHLSGIFSSSSTTDGNNGYMETVYPIFSMFALLSLHIFLYGCNIYQWKSTRINQNFIFEFSPHTALKHRDAFLISSGFMTTVVAAMVIHLLLVSAGISPRHVDSIPGILLLIFTVMLVLPLNVCYRSTRYSFLRVIRNIVLSPFYKVLMVDFFMADQLTSQIPLMRHMEFTACFFMAGGFRTHSYATCSTSKQYKLLAYFLSFLPYYWRAMQCLRRYVEEGYDSNHLANAGKYISAMVAAAARMKYAITPTPVWMAAVVLTSSAATIYQLYWDFVKDWGFFNRSSKNPWLRDDLVLKNKSIYYISILLNFVLRLAWVQTITHVNMGKIEHRMVDFLFASLEIIRRGHWNFYRLENEHLNNVGKFRAVKAVPLPFREIDSD